MKRFFQSYLIPISIFFALLLSVNCQRDDICDVPEITPRLIIEFIDDDINNRDTLPKSVNSLAVKLVGDALTNSTKEDGFFTDFIETLGEAETIIRIAPNTTSISLPLSTLDDELTFEFIENFSDPENELTDTEILTFKYNRKENFINRACGFQTTFEELTVEKTTNTWISRIELLKTTITDEEDRHLLLYH